LRALRLAFCIRLRQAAVGVPSALEILRALRQA